MLGVGSLQYLEKKNFLRPALEDGWFLFVRITFLGFQSPVPVIEEVLLGPVSRLSIPRCIQSSPASASSSPLVTVKGVGECLQGHGPCGRMQESVCPKQQGESTVLKAEEGLKSELWFGIKYPKFLSACSGHDHSGPWLLFSGLTDSQHFH